MNTPIVIVILAMCQGAIAAVDRIEVKSREPFYASKIGPYVKITGSFTGSLDAGDPIPNLDHATRRADGRIEYASEFTILAPEQASAGNHVLLVDAENGGRPITNGLYNTPFGSNAGQPAGNGFLEDNGYTIVNVHWQEGRGIRLPQYTDKSGHAAPLLAVGFAAVRDFAAFLRFETKDRAGTANPVAGSIQWAIASGQSQSSRFLKSFIYEGFNRVGDRLVIDGFQPNVGQSGTMPFIAPPGVSAKTLDLTITGDSSVFPFTYEEIFAPWPKGTSARQRLSRRMLKATTFAAGCRSCELAARALRTRRFLRRSGYGISRLRRSRLLSVPEHDGHCSRLKISLKISGVLGSSVFTRVCIYMGPVTHQVVYDQGNQLILCFASITTHIPVISLGYEAG